MAPSNTCNRNLRQRQSKPERTQTFFDKEPAARWAQLYSAGKFCQGDGRELGWIPEVGLDSARSARCSCLFQIICCTSSRIFGDFIEILTVCFEEVAAHALSQPSEATVTKDLTPQKPKLSRSVDLGRTLSPEPCLRQTFLAGFVCFVGLATG